jgi:hypothetical protein
MVASPAGKSRVHEYELRAETSSFLRHSQAVMTLGRREA